MDEHDKEYFRKMRKATKEDYKKFRDIYDPEKTVLIVPNTNFRDKEIDEGAYRRSGKNLNMTKVPRDWLQDVIATVEDCDDYVHILQNTVNRDRVDRMILLGTPQPPWNHKDTIKQLEHIVGCLRKLVKERNEKS